MTEQIDLSGRYALVTGASRGIGRAAALALAKAGAHVIILARSQGALEELDDEIKAAGGKASLIAVDLADYAALNQLAPALEDRFGKLDIFIGNAGVLGELCPITDIDKKTWDSTLGINFLANWQLTAVLDPLLRQSDAARVVFVTTSTTESFKPFWGAYTVSKAAMEAMALTYAHEVEKTNIRVNLMNPGATRTQMRAKAMPGEDPSTLPPPDEVADLILEMASPAFTDNATRINYRDWRQSR